MEDGDEKLELEDEAKADEGEEKRELDVEYEQNLLEGETERSTGPLDLVLEDVAIDSRRRRRREGGDREGKGKRDLFFFFLKGPPWGVGLANLASFGGRFYRWLQARARRELGQRRGQGCSGLLDPLEELGWLTQPWLTEG